jgi:hypothetical protein
VVPLPVRGAVSGYGGAFAVLCDPCVELYRAAVLAADRLLIETIEADRYPLSPRIRRLRQILAKFAPMGPAPPPGLQLAAGDGPEDGRRGSPPRRNAAV